MGLLGTAGAAAASGGGLLATDSTTGSLSLLLGLTETGKALLLPCRLRDATLDALLLAAFFQAGLVVPLFEAGFLDFFL